MNNFKNLLVTALTGLLAISLFIYPAQAAGKSKEAKSMEYLACLQDHLPSSPGFGVILDIAIKNCAKYRP
jgi:hypothetical protein